MPPPTLLDGHELAEELAASYDDVMTWSRRQVIPSIRVGARRFFNLKRVVESLRDRQRLAAPIEVAADSDPARAEAVSA